MGGVDSRSFVVSVSTEHILPALPWVLEAGYSRMGLVEG